MEGLAVEEGGSWVFVEDLAGDRDFSVECLAEDNLCFCGDNLEGERRTYLRSLMLILLKISKT